MDHERMETFIGDTCRIEGTLNVEHGITISGRFKGNIKAGGKVIVSSTGEIQADIEADELVTAGKITGNVTAKKRTVIHSTGSIIGKLKTDKLLLEEGGLLNGDINMGASSAQAHEIKNRPHEKEKSE
ncbi:MAG TPA: polymer-forming cytoskeletal protein [Candidatus Mcinerneyibacteriales bacterium]|jgi:cytoskeletal protein CcmA (bactofilin family)|nr:polymer-forming cytoskeletal protein [Candidatus Mcinerneyibacteriales bacterium]